jgi:hypothetical protein
MDQSISQVNEIFLNDPNAKFQSAPSSINIDLYKGLEGERGSYVIPGLGDPNLQTKFRILDSEGKEQFISAKPLDWFINLQPGDDTYLTVFQLNEKTFLWDKIFKTIPNVYSRNIVSEFVDGEVDILIEVPREGLRIEQLFGTGGREDLSTYRIPDSEDVVDTVSSELEMLSLSGAEEKQYAYRTDQSKFFRLSKEPASLVENWQEELSININIDLQAELPAGTNFDLPLPTSKSFILETPYSDENSYYFPIKIYASKITELGFQKLDEERTIHTTISVI